ncbi:MAG: hypothetical protein QM723_06490 [Myxococcaceae bacterium]
MKRYIGVLFAIAFVIIAIVFAYKKYDQKATEAARDVTEAQLRQQYYERVAWINNIPDQKAYTNEVTTFLGWWFKQVTEYNNRFHGNSKFDDYLAELKEREGKPGKNEKLDDKKAVYEYERKIFDMLKGGNYSPQWSATDHGIRLDIVSTDPVNVGGEQKIRYQVIVWGLPRETRETDERHTKKVQTNASFQITWKFTDEKGRLLAEMNANGDPSNKIDYPERFIKWFPPGLYLGHYDVDLIPNEVPPQDEKAKDKKPVPVKTAEITFHIGARSPSGGDMGSTLTWKLDVPAEWKLKPGEVWKNAGVDVRPEEEIDPSKKEKEPKG